MMKKVLVLLMVLAMSAFATAATVSLEAVGSVEPSQVITINVVADGFNLSAPVDEIARLKIAQVLGEGTASNAALNAGFNDLSEPGVLINAGGVLIEGVDGSKGLGSPLISGVLYSFDLHIPELPYSTIILVDLVGTEVTMPFGNDIPFQYGGPLELHVTPEPMTVALLGLGGLFLRRRK